MASSPTRHVEAQPGAAAPALRAVAQLAWLQAQSGTGEGSERTGTGNWYLRDASEARILRAVLSPRQLDEVMVDFWFNHFNVFSGKGLDDVWIGKYERQAIRPFVLGRFRDLLFATTKHPAMLVYLDNALSTAPGSPGARGRQKGLNENFAREVIELHTLGADGGYTQEEHRHLGPSFYRVGRQFAECPPVSRIRRGFRGRASRLQSKGFSRPTANVARQGRG